MINITNKRFVGNPCRVCGNTIRFKSNKICVACVKRKFKDTGAGEKNRIKVKTEVVLAYGSRCACCGETGLIFLNIDHISQNGSDHRKSCPEAKAGGKRFYLWLKKRGYPEGYRVLCFNCNFAVYHLGTCPHQGIPK